MMGSRSSSSQTHSNGDNSAVNTSTINNGGAVNRTGAGFTNTALTDVLTNISNA